jgi:hypothetical protein
MFEQKKTAARAYPASPRAVFISYLISPHRPTALTHAASTAGAARGSFLSVKVHTVSFPLPRCSTATHLDATRHSAEL